ncbi:MAG: radical SAM protein [Desulfuromonadaceae bacterium]|nr:radical SAM protein [Desulfuromonadaceae bacterium]MDD2856271.1 radical SAM protein [Desulfuromonadaceae bacterium]
MRAVTVPFFISHQGCPHICVFCDQRTISGSDGALPDSGQILSTIDQWRETAGGRPLEVAFFGGTFTALPHDIQASLLEPLQKLLEDRIVQSIRLSTRPDYIDSDRVVWLAGMGVTTIELGVQSMDDAVLAASGRGHSGADSLYALNCIKNAGLTAGAQLMPGLPMDTPISSLDSLERVISAGADFLRIYPTVVLSGTELERKYLSGEFIPLTLDRGVALCAILLQRSMQAGIPVIRTGLQADSGLNSANIVAGCWHPAFGQLVRSRMYSDLIDQAVAPDEYVTLHCHSTRISDLLGMKKYNLRRQAERGVVMQVLSDPDLEREELRVTVKNSSKIYSIITDLHYSIHEV